MFLADQSFAECFKMLNALIKMLLIHPSVLKLSFVSECKTFSVNIQVSFL